MKIAQSDYAKLFHFVTADPRGRFLLPYMMASVFGFFTPLFVGVYQMNKTFPIDKLHNA